MRIEYRKATPDESQLIYDIVQGTKGEIYPHYYTQAVVDFFGRIHSLEKISEDVMDGKIDVLIIDGRIVGTGSREENHITRVYVLPEYESMGYGSMIMDHLETDIFSKYEECDLDASLPAALFYEHRGYRTVEHKKHDIGDGEVMIYEIMKKNREYEIDTAGNDDLPEILQLQYRAYQSEAALFRGKKIPPLTQSLEELTKECEEGIILKMTDQEGTILGSVRAKELDGTIYIGKLMVSPEHRGKGYGTRLLLSIEKRFTDKRYELFTSTKSEANVKMYQRLGYRAFDTKQMDDELTFVHLEKLII